MAKATLEKKVITPAVAEVSEKIITLVLNEKEAQFLRELTGTMHGSDTGYILRNINAGIYSALAPFTGRSSYQLAFIPAQFKGEY